MRRDCEISAVSSLFGHPVVAAALGALLGVFLTFISHRAASRVTPDDPMRGLATVALMMGARFGIVLTALGAYYVLARSGLYVFGPVLAVSFIAGLVFEAVRVSYPRASHTSA